MYKIPAHAMNLLTYNEPSSFYCEYETTFKVLHFISFCLQWTILKVRNHILLCQPSKYKQSIIKLWELNGPNGICPTSCIQQITVILKFKTDGPLQFFYFYFSVHLQ